MRVASLIQKNSDQRYHRFYLSEARTRKRQLLKLTTNLLSILFLCPTNLNEYFISICKSNGNRSDDSHVSAAKIKEKNANWMFRFEPLYESEIIVILSDLR